MNGECINSQVPDRFSGTIINQFLLLASPDELSRVNHGNVNPVAVTLYCASEFPVKAQAGGIQLLDF